MSLAGIHRLRPGYRPTEGGGPTNPPQGGSGGSDTTERLIAWGIPRDSDLGRAIEAMEGLSGDETGPGATRTPSHDGSLASLVAWPVWAAVHILTLGRMGRPLFQEEDPE